MHDLDIHEMSQQDLAEVTNHKYILRLPGKFWVNYLF